MLYDVFISHASEDKEELVRPLAQMLKKNRVEVWYDEFSLKLGDSLRGSIDIGLTKSRYGIVILSKNFFNKGWPQWELDGLVQRQINAKANLILPIWHGVTKEDLIEYSPSLADKVAVSSDKGLDHITTELLKMIRPEGSTLIIARDILLEFGYEPPVVTDDWWLDVAEYCGTDPVRGRWGFPLPDKKEGPPNRGERLAWTAMQMLWQSTADKLEISQITPPSRVLDFIGNMPGLARACHDFPEFLAACVPQLTIRGFGDSFEDDFEACYQESLDMHEGGMMALHWVPTPFPECEVDWSLRDPNFGGHEPLEVAYHFAAGHLYESIRELYKPHYYINWLSSEKSSWMPKEIREFLLLGFDEWNEQLKKERGSGGYWSTLNYVDKRRMSGFLQLELTDSYDKDLGGEFP